MVFPGEFFTHFVSKNLVKWNIDLTWLKKFHTHSNRNTWDPLMIELLYLPLSGPPPFCSSRTLTDENEILNSMYFYSKNVFTTKGWSRWKMCCICKYALLFIFLSLFAWRYKFLVINVCFKNLYVNIWKIFLCLEYRAKPPNYFLNLTYFHKIISIVQKSNMIDSMFKPVFC